MDFLKKLSFLIFIFLSPGLKKTSAQSLIGKVIHVSPAQEVMLKFRSVISNFNFTNKDASGFFQTRITNNKNFSISSTVGGFKPTSLIINEGENTHLFTIDYKEILDVSENLYDFSNRRTLKAIADTLIKKANTETDSVHLNDKLIERVPKVQEPVKLTQREIDEKYSEIVTKANKDFLNKKYDEARELYTAALELKPKDPWSMNQLADIGNRKSNLQKEDQQKISEAIYQNHKRVGDSAFNKKSYETARFQYNQAIKEKADDPYSLSQLKKIDQALKNDSYLSFMNIGRDAVNNQLFDNAVMAFNEALAIRPKDPDATKELFKIGLVKTEAVKKKKDDNLVAEKQAQYNDTISLADNMFEAGMFEQSRKKYKKADLLKPGIAYPIKQIAVIDSILLKRKSETSSRKQDSINTITYNNETEKGKKALENSDLKKARSHFQLAQNLKPSEKYPAEKISEIDILMEKNQKDKIDEAARKTERDKTDNQYNFFIKQGITAAKGNNFAVAKEFFLKALELKPGEKIPTDQLNVANKELQEIRNKERYELFIHRGDSIAFIVKDYRTSLKWFDSASILKPAETYPRKRIITVNQMMLKRDSLVMETENAKERNTKYNEVIDSYNKADAARLQRKYEDAYKGYAEFLTKIDPLSFDKYTTSQQYTIKQARDMLGRLQQYKTNPVADSLRQAHIQDSLNNLKPAKKRKKKN